jgi:hypothetical protein
MLLLFLMWNLSLGKQKGQVMHNLGSKIFHYLFIPTSSLVNIADWSN